MLSPLIQGLTWILIRLYELTHSYGLAIILLTVVIKMALYPLSVKQMRSLKITQALQPKIKEAQEKYKNDPQKAQMAVMEIYKQYGASPLAGCLPLLIQLPILWALFSALRNPKLPPGINMSFLYNPDLHIFGKSFWLHSLSKPDPFFILPLLAVVSTFLMQRLTTNMQDQTQKTMLFAMPLMIGFFTYSLPSGLGLYWVISNVVGIIQQYIINRQPLPVIVKEDMPKDEGSQGNQGSRKKRKNDRGSR